VLGHGQALIALGDTDAGLAQLDEVMVAITGAEVGPVVSGIVYCAVIIECLGLFDLARAAEWTDALGAWCEAQPDLVPYRGQCLVHRSQLQQAAGRWPEAIATAEEACHRLTDPPHPALGLAHYQEAELHRLVGSFERAESEYREASRHGHHPMPGLALLELARGDARAAAVTIRRALQETRAPLERPALLAAAVEIFRGAGDRSGAREAADKLVAVASPSSSPLLRAMAALAMGSVLAAEGDPVGALPELRTASLAWQSLRMPHEAARTAVLCGLAYAALGDRITARLELDNARATFTELGARPDLDHLDELTGLLGEPADDVLSEREREVLAHLAAGETNREIAAALTISPHTVGRHVENLFAKLGVTSRAAATAYAYEHDLLPKPTQR
jgi:DNA-binding CsgD family transcriptional regulator